MGKGEREKERGGATANDMEGGSKSMGGGRGGMMTNSIGGGGGGERARANEYTWKYLTGSTLVWYSSKQGTIHMGRLKFFDCKGGGSVPSAFFVAADDTVEL